MRQQNDSFSEWGSVSRPPPSSSPLPPHLLTNATALTPHTISTPDSCAAAQDGTDALCAFLCDQLSQSLRYPVSRVPGALGCSCAPADAQPAHRAMGPTLH